MSSFSQKIEDGQVVVFTPYIRKNGKIIRPRNARVFRFVVNKKRSS